ncbi:MAG: hypothetical protein AAFZ17_11620, partial [Cyanobacteria bacterium J06650_10]
EQPTISLTINSLSSQNEILYSIVPTAEGRFEGYDRYIEKLESRLYEKSQHYDLVMLDSVQIGEYSTRGGIDSFQRLLKNHPVHGGSLQRTNSPVLEVARTRYGFIEALPITRNFHLPARGARFSAESEGWNTLVEFLSADQTSTGKVEHLIEINKTEGSGKSSHIPRIYLSAKHKICFSDYTADTLETEVPFLLDSEFPFFIPMQLARGNHAAYTFMAYTANADERRSSLIQIISPYRSETSSGASSPKSFYLCKKESLIKRLRKVFQLAFLYVPTGALCLDHQIAARLRQKESESWFDPCLPIEAVGFHDNNYCIKILPKPATLDNEPLGCLGGFCLGVTKSSRDSVDAAGVALDIVRQFSELSENFLRSERSSDENSGAFELFRSDWAIETSAFLSDQDDGTGTNESENAEYLIPTPKKIALRPNVNFWPILEGRISFAFRLYLAATFIFRAIHRDCLHLQTISWAQAKETLLVGKNSNGLRMDYRNEEEFEEHKIKRLEMDYLDNLQPEQIKNYFINVRDVAVDSLSDDSINTESDPSDRREEASRFIRLNFDEIITNHDYLCGILQNASQEAAKTILRFDGNTHLYSHVRNSELFILNDEEILKAHRRACIFLDAMVKAMSETFINDLESEFAIRGWSVRHEI